MPWGQVPTVTLGHPGTTAALRWATSPSCRLLLNILSLRCGEPSWLPGGRAAAIRASQARRSTAPGSPSSHSAGSEGDGRPPCPQGDVGQPLGSAATRQGRAVRLELNCPPRAPPCPQPSAAGMGSAGCRVPQPRAVHAASSTGARVPAPARADRARQQPRPAPINVARYSRYTLTPLFVPRSPAGASCQHRGPRARPVHAATAVPGAAQGPRPSDPAELSQAPSTAGHQRPQRQQCRGSGRGSRTSTRELHNGLVRKSTREPVYWERGGRRAAQPRGVPVPQPRSVLLLRAPAAALRTVPVPSAWHHDGSRSSASPGPSSPGVQRPWGQGGCFGGPRAAGSPWPNTPGLRPGHLRPPPGQNLGSEGSCGSVQRPSPCVHRPTRGRRQGPGPRGEQPWAPHSPLGGLLDGGVSKNHSQGLFFRGFERDFGKTRAELLRKPDPRT